MRNYWLKIALGALGVFIAGMVVIAVIRRLRTTVTAMAHSSEPISIPLAFVPFKVDGVKLGTFDRAVLIRKSPKNVAALNLGVKLGDSMSADKLHDCVLLARFNSVPGQDSTQFSNADFTCLKTDSALALGAEPFGHVSFKPGGREIALFVPADVAKHLRHDAFRMDATGASDAADSIADAAERLADSVSDAASQAADSIAAFHEHRADSVRDMALRRADSIRRAAQRLRDSVHAKMHR